MSTWKSKYNQIKHLVQYKNKTDEEIKEIAKKLVSEEEKQKENTYDVEWEGLATSEKKKATVLFNDYSKKYQIEKLSDLEDLKQLIYTGALKERVQHKLLEIANQNAVPPEVIVKTLDTITKQENALKDRLGLGLEKKESKWKTFWVNFKKKLNNYALSHKGAFYFKCPKCQEMALLLRKTKDYNTFPFAMFRGTYVYNEEMFKDIDSGKITKEDVSRYWGLQNTDYINWIYEKLYLQEKESK